MRCSIPACALFSIACGTQDVEEAPPPPELYELRDAAFGEYLQHLEVPGISAEDRDGTTVYVVDANLVDGVGALPLSKTSTRVEELVEAGLTTAEQKIVDVDGIQLFVNLTDLSLTANDVRDLDLTALADLVELSMNFNLVGNLDLSGNPNLELLRYRGSSQAEDGEKLSSIDLSNNPELRHLHLPDHEIVTIDLSNNLAIVEELDLSGNPGPDGNPDTPDIVVPAEIYDQVDPDRRLGVTSDADAGVTVSLVASAPTVLEGNDALTLTASLNTSASGDVTVTLDFSGSATFDADYTVAATTLTVPAGELTASTTLTTIDDADEEGIEIIEAFLDAITGADPGATTALELTIDGDDLDPGILINEVLYDPSNEEADADGDLPGDANHDGIYVQDEDEFVEFVNTSGTPLDLGDWKIWDTEAWTDGVPRHVVPAGTVLTEGAVLVLFGGGTPTGDFGGAMVQVTSTGAMNLNNSGDLLRVTDASDRLVLQFDVEPLSNNPNESYTRNPDLTGDFEQHADVSDTLFSPGTRLDGSPL